MYNATNSSGQDSILTLQVGGSSAGDAYISFDIKNEAGWAWGVDNDDSNKMKLGTNWDSVSTNTKMTIDTSGKVGIGTTSPNAELDVNGHIHCNSIQTGTSRYEQHLVKSNLIRLRFTSGASTPTTQSAMDTYFESLSSGTKSLSRPRLAANNSLNTFADTFEGYLKVTTAGTHYFGLNSDDASDMYINGIQVAYWYGGHAHNGTTTTPGGTTGNIYLKTGYHKIFVRFQENGGGEALYSLWKEPGDSSWSEIPADNCFYDHIRYH